MKVALITGASSGIGRAAAELFAAKGYRTFGTVRNEGGLQMDVRDEVSVQRAIASVMEQAGRIDVLVNNAGVTLLGALEETSVNEARELFETNFFGAMRVINAVLPIMRAQRSGRIVNVSSVLGFLPAPFMGVYAASKHALEGYSESLDHEVRAFGIRVSLIEPPFTKTRLGANSRRTQLAVADYAEQRQRVAGRIAAGLQRGLDPEDVAHAILRAATGAPAMRVPVGRQAKLLKLMRGFAPGLVTP